MNDTVDVPVPFDAEAAPVLGCRARREAVGRYLSGLLKERHHLLTGSARARTLLEDWDNARAQFVKIMPKDYRRALLELKAEREAAQMVAAE